MSVEQLEEQIQKLPREELGRLIEWLDSFLGRFSGGNQGHEDDLNDSEMAELLRRRKDLEANPNLAQPMDEEYFAVLKRDFENGSGSKASGS